VPTGGQHEGLVLKWPWYSAPLVVVIFEGGSVVTGSTQGVLKKII
jgi:hypothetical protein